VDRLLEYTLEVRHMLLGLIGTAIEIAPAPWTRSAPPWRPQPQPTTRTPGGWRTPGTTLGDSNGSGVIQGPRRVCDGLALG
jgi:hypothetical protein